MQTVKKTVDPTVDYLASYGEKDAQWDKHRANLETITSYYRHCEEFESLAKRTYSCSRYLLFKRCTDPQGNSAIKLQRVFTCKVRFCTVCSWARTRVWRRRFLISIPQVIQYNPTARFIFLTLTVQNCDITDLNSTIKLMSKAFKRLMDRRGVQRVVLGYARSCEVTKSVNGTAHPHFHILLMVKPSYFANNYIKQDDWVKLWQESLQVDYTPVVDIRSVKPKKEFDDRDGNKIKLSHHEGLIHGVLEVAKYGTKPSDLIGEPRDKKGKRLGYTGNINHRDWFLELTRQMHGVKHVVLGGILKQYMTDEEPDSNEILEAVNDEKDILNIDSDDLFFFNWWGDVKKYGRKL
jgi:plasmid rolling circle replication initiator protein Rep